MIGAGGHAKVVFEAMLALNIDWTSIFVRASHGESFMGIPVAYPECLPDMGGYDCHIAIGDNAVRASLMRQVVDAGADIQSIVHPGSNIALTAAIEEGCFVGAGAIVSAMAIVEAGAIINHGAIADHDCSVGYCSHIAPGAVLGGAAQIGRQVLIGANATVLPGRAVGDHAVVGAGSVVTKNIPPSSLWIGSALVSKEQ